MRAFLAGYDCGEATGYALGHCAGYAEGYERAVTEMTPVLTEAIDAHLRDCSTVTNKAVVDLVLNRGDYADRAERRGQPERAARQRQTLMERGLA